MGKSGASLWQRLVKNISYCVNGVWDDSRTLLKVRAIKIVNLSVRSFLNRDLQIRAGSLTYNTVLAVVPALAMLFAIARGFGFQNLLQNELFRYFPSQQRALETALTYVDNYLAQASQGVFIGIGLVLLLWTLLTLMSNVEDTFNHVWGITAKRSLRHKFTDYTAIMLLLPLLMLCSAGISIFMSDAVQHVFEGDLLTPVAHRLLSFTPTVIAWIVFTAAYYLVPNTRVNFKAALFAGVLCGTTFQMVQWFFVSGQVYVSKYNAIYGSFAFLPLLLVWLQLSWLITLSGVVLTYAWQNFDRFSYNDKVSDISQAYANDLAVAVLALAAKRFKTRQKPLTADELITAYDLPAPLANDVLARLQRAGMLTAINTDDAKQGVSYQPAFDPDDLTVNTALNALTTVGCANFIVKADTHFGDALKAIATLRQHQQQAVDDVTLLSIV